MRNQRSWNIVSRSFGDALPPADSPVSPTLTLALATFPVSNLLSVMGLKSPAPATASPMNCASSCSFSANVELPPGRRAVKRISSFLKSVGLSSTRMPFESVHSVMPVSGNTFEATTRPALGNVGTSGLLLVESTNATSLAFFTLSKMASSSARVGSVTSARAGAETITTRFVRGVQSRAARLISSTVMLGSTCLASACAVSTEGIFPLPRKLFTY